MKNTVRRWQATASSAGLSILFLVVYGSCNWLTAHRPHVGSIYFEWERFVPFVPLMIPAYLSLDLFFIGAPFLCRTNEELRAYSKRIAAAILIAGSCFLLFPLRFAFSRPESNGLLGTIFNWFRDIDAPNNLLPSLHAALLLLVGDVYLRYLRGGLRVTAFGWFVLIGVSPVLTYQHHLIDIFAGFALAASCFYLFPDCTAEKRTNTNSRIGFYYLFGSVSLIVASII
ncbi:MAG TPA: phosphatase PAP2 family protein, partial [Chthoniobacterales bacterium]